ncbi:hypothetical protein E2542_SST13792 [Spatholobus suberectus]|nr:hypothetical protein E2542_SST13792 [Spatholobus suberectus]
MSLMSPRTEKLVRRLTIVTTVTASYFLLTADYGPQPNALDPPVLHLQDCLNDWPDGSKQRPIQLCFWHRCYLKLPSTATCHNQLYCPFVVAST